jgi:hypothetical protein
LQELIDLIEEATSFASGTSKIVGRKPEWNFTLKQWTGCKWRLQYRGSRDGFQAKTFHSSCNNKGPTLTIVQCTKGYVFGGYARVPWTSSASHHSDTNAFLFTLTNPSNLAPTKFARTGSGNELYDGISYGPTFGGGHGSYNYEFDLHIADQCNSNTSSYSVLGSSFSNSSGSSSVLTGTKNFQVKEIEVFVME